MSSIIAAKSCTEVGHNRLLCKARTVSDSLLWIVSQKFATEYSAKVQPPFFVRNTLCKAPVGFPLTPRGLTEVVRFKARRAAARKVPVVVNLRKDQDTTPFEVCAVGQRPTRKGIESRRFEERELELLLLGECAVAKPHQTVLLGFDIIHLVLRHVDLGDHLVPLPQTHVVDKNDVVVRRAVLVQLTDELAHFLPSGAGVCLR